MPSSLSRRIVRKLYQQYLGMRFRLFDHKRHNRLVLDRVGDIPLVVLPEVFNPALFATATLFLKVIDATDRLQGARTLDLGTGTGVLGIAAARRGAVVTGTDLNTHAMRCARINAILNDVEMDLRTGDLFEPVGDEKFDLVLFSPPMFEGDPKDGMEMAFFARGIVDRFFDQLASHLLPGGCALLRASSTASLELCNRAAERNAMHVATMAMASTPSEIYYILKVAPAA